MVAAARAVGAVEGRALHARDDGRDERAARAQGRAHGVRRHSRASSISSTCGARPRAPLPALRRPPRAARAARALLRRAGADRAGRRARTARPGLAAGARRARRSRSACCSRSGIRRTSGRSPTSCGGGCPARASSPRTRSSPEFREYERASTTAVDAYLGPVLARTCGGWPRRATAGLPEPLVMRSSGGVGDGRGGGGASVLGARVGAGRRASCGAELVARRPGSRRDLVRHGRDIDRRVPDRGRFDGRAVGGTVGGGLPVRLPTVDLHTVGAGGGRSSGGTRAARSASGPRARAPIRAPPATAVAERDRPSPTRTSSSDGCQIASRAGSSSTERPPSGRSTGSTRGGRSRP